MIQSNGGPTAPPTPRGGFRHCHRVPIPEETLTFREKKVLAAVRAAEAPITVHDLARLCFPGVRAKPNQYETKRADGTKVRRATAAADRCVLNSLRRLVAGSFVEKVDRGTYAALDLRTTSPAIAAKAATAKAPSTKAPATAPDPVPSPASVVQAPRTSAQKRPPARPRAASAAPTTAPTAAPTATPTDRSPKMIVRKGLLYAVLTQLCRGIDRSSSMPILSHVKLDADGTTLRVEATDLVSHVVATIPCRGRFSGCLPAKAFADFVKPEDAKDKQTVVELLPDEGGKVTVAVEAALTTMIALPTTDFPRRPGDKHAAHDWQGAATWRASDFAGALGWVSLACGTDETRRHLSGVLFAADRIVGLDGHRLHLCRMSGIGGATPTLIAGTSIVALLRLLPKSGDVAAQRAKDTIRFACTNGDVQWEIETQAMTETFPPYDQVIPAEGNEAYRAEVDRAALLRGIARMPRSRDKRHIGVRMVVNGAIRLERDGDDGVASCTVPVLSTTHEGADSVLGVNAVYITDALSCDVPVVIGRFGGELDPIRFDLGPDKLAVVMPMRL